MKTTSNIGGWLPAPDIRPITIVQTAIGPARLLNDRAFLNGQPALYVKYKRSDFPPELKWPFVGDYVFKVIPQPICRKENENDTETARPLLCGI